MGTIASQITSLTMVYSMVYSDADQIKHQSSTSLAFVRGIPRTNGQLRGKCFQLMTSSWSASLQVHRFPTPQLQGTDEWTCMWKSQIQCSAVNTVNFLTNVHKCSPIRTSYGVSFVDQASDWYSASVSVIIYVVSYNIGLHYKSTWLYFIKASFHMFVPLGLIQPTL